MKHPALILVLLAIALTGCAAAPTQDARADPAVAATLSPKQAVMMAAEAAPKGVDGVFELEVRGSGRDRFRTYLNSEADYRDQRNLTIALSPAAVEALRQRLGADPADALRGRRIIVTGTAERVRIDFTGNGMPTGKYYYQTHVRVTGAVQIMVL
jgi:hypothetical protein